MTNSISYKTQMTAEVDVDIADATKVEDYCVQQGDTYQSIDEFAERLSCVFWKSTPQEDDCGMTIRDLEIGTFVEDSDGFTHRLSAQHADLLGDITLTISKEFDSENVEKIS